jgi:hypothetical protein
MAHHPAPWHVTALAAIAAGSLKVSIAVTPAHGHDTMPPQRNVKDAPAQAGGFSGLEPSIFRRASP